LGETLTAFLQSHWTWCSVAAASASVS